MRNVIFGYLEFLIVMAVGLRIRVTECKWQAKNRKPEGRRQAISRCAFSVWRIGMLDAMIGLLDESYAVRIYLAVIFMPEVKTRFEDL